MNVVSGSSKYITPSQTATHTTGTGSRNRRAPSVTSLGEVSSDLSPGNSLMTPPAQANMFLAPIYCPVGSPPAVSGTSRTAPVLLPTQTHGMGRANPVNLPPTQRPDIRFLDLPPFFLRILLVDDAIFVLRESKHIDSDLRASRHLSTRDCPACTCVINFACSIYDTIGLYFSYQT